MVADEAISAVANGTGIVLQNLKWLKDTQVK